MSTISIIAGLGNPGPQYEETRHNIGFLVLDSFISRCSSIRVRRREADAEVASVTVGEREVWFIKPLTFMNRSGQPLQKVIRAQSRSLDELLVVHDELDLPFGTIRLKSGGGEGGHNGLRSITQELGGNTFHRLRFGIGRPPHPDYEVHRWVLSRFLDEEKASRTQLIEKACDMIECAIKEGIKVTQNRFHGGA